MPLRVRRVHTQDCSQVLEFPKARAHRGGRARRRVRRVRAPTVTNIVPCPAVVSGGRVRRSCPAVVSGSRVRQPSSRWRALCPCVSQDSFTHFTHFTHFSPISPSNRKLVCGQVFVEIIFLRNKCTNSTLNLGGEMGEMWVKWVKWVKKSWDVHGKQSSTKRTRPPDTTAGHAGLDVVPRHLERTAAGSRTRRGLRAGRVPARARPPR